jgi:hypothetical protein
LRLVFGPSIDNRNIGEGGKMSLERTLDAPNAFSSCEIGPWWKAGNEPTTTEILADPITILLMRADRLDPGEVVTLLRAARQRRALQ